LDGNDGVPGTARRAHRLALRHWLAVRVQVSRVDLDGRRIDFRLLQEGEELGSPLGKDKGKKPRRRS
jgi:ribonuclease R